MVAGAATVASLALFGTGPGDSTALPAPALAPVGAQLPQTAPNAVGDGGFAADGTDNTGVNDNGQTSGDIFQQNAQDQSTA
jgi:hypothetical protein